MRAGLYAVVVSRSHEAEFVAGLAEVERAAREAVESASLVPGEGWRPWPGLEQPLHAASLSAARLLAEVPPPQIGVCPGDGCGWVFLDPRGRRRWCRMEWCGNRDKQRARAARARSRC